MKIIKRAVPEGTVPLISVEGTAYECGRAYGEIVLSKYPGYMRYLKEVPEWGKKSRLVTSLFEKKAPHVLDIYRGMQSALNPPRPSATPPQEGTLRSSGIRAYVPLLGGVRKAGGGSESGRKRFFQVTQTREACTSFSIHPALTLDKTPLSGQNKDTPEGALKYIVLRMRIKKAPTILVLAYPGEILGYGMWSTGMTIFRNSLYSKGNPQGKLSMVEWGLLALAGKSVYEARELAEKHGILVHGNFLITDSAGESVSIESNAGGVSSIPPKKGINTHANHPVGKKTIPFDDKNHPDKIEKINSRYRMNFLWKLLNAERGKLTAQKALMCLADHSRYPLGICRHIVGKTTEIDTTAAVVAEPAKGRLHVVRGHPCCNWPVSFEL